MLIHNKDINQRLNINVISQDAPSDTKNYYDKLLTNFGVTAINKPFDTELYEYQPVSKSVNYFIYFLSFKDVDFNQSVIKNIEPAFTDYYNLAKSRLKIIHKGSGFDFLQNNGNLQVTTHKDMFSTATTVAINKPYQVTDIVQEVNKQTPIKSGLPLFYDTFTFPFSEKISTWDTRPNKFSDLPALYNSFLLLDFYTSPNSLTQQKMLSLPIFVVDRYMMYEKSVNGVKQLRPTFMLKNGVEGYSIFFLQNFGINRLYIRYSFWDAMNGMRIPLIASSVHTPKKKCIQSVSSFDHRNEYIMVDLDSDKKSYRMYEFNTDTKQYDIQAYDFDLYELFYDDFWAGKLVKNTRPIPLEEPTSYIINFNQTIDLTLNQTKIIVNDKEYLTDIPQNTLNNYYDTRYLNGASSYIKDYIRDTFTQLKTTKSVLPTTIKTLFIDKNNNELKSNCFKKNIETIKIRNNNNNNVNIYDIFVSDINFSHTPIYNSDLYGNIERKNTMLVNNINRKSVVSTTNKQAILVENYITYKDLGVLNDKKDLIDELYRIYGQKFSSEYNKNEANKYNIIENIDFDTNNPNSLATYLRNNYIFTNSGQLRYSFSATGRGKASGLEKYVDSIGGYYNILRDYNESDLFIKTFIFQNLDQVKKNRFINDLIYIDKTKYAIKLAKDIDYEKNTSYWFTNKQINEEILPNLNDIRTIIKNLDFKFTSSDLRERELWLRDCMAGFNVEYETDNGTLGLNEILDIKVNLFIGEQFIVSALNPNNNLNITATIKIIMSDRYSNRKTYTIPIDYTLNLI